MPVIKLLIFILFWSILGRAFVKTAFTWGKKNCIADCGFSQWLSVNNLPAVQETGVWSLGRADPWTRAWQPTPVFLPGESHGQRSLTTVHRVIKSPTQLKRLSTHALRLQHLWREAWSAEKGSVCMSQVRHSVQPLRHNPIPCTPLSEIYELHPPEALVHPRGMYSSPKVVHKFLFSLSWVYCSFIKK